MLWNHLAACQSLKTWMYFERQVSGDIGDHLGPTSNFDTSVRFRWYDFLVGSFNPSEKY